MSRPSTRLTESFRNAENGRTCGGDKDEGSEADAEPGSEVSLKERAGVHPEMGGGLEDGHDDERSREHRKETEEDLAVSGW